MLTVPGVDSVVAAGLTAEERSVVAVDSRGAILVVDADTGSVRDTVAGPPGFQVNGDDSDDAAVSAGGDLVARVEPANSDPIGNVDPNGRISVYDLANHRNTASIPGADITSVRYAGSLLPVQRANRNLELWDARGTAMSRVISGEQSYECPATADQHGGLVARLRGDNAIDIFDAGTGDTGRFDPGLSGQFSHRLCVLARWECACHRHREGN